MVSTVKLSSRFGQTSSSTVDWYTRQSQLTIWLGNLSRWFYFELLPKMYIVLTYYRGTDLQYLINNNTSVYCPQTFSATDTTQSCQAFCTHYQISTAALIALNGGVSCQSLGDDSYCAPRSCAVALVSQYTDYQPFVDNYSNMTYAQFLAWNPFVGSSTLLPGEVVCVGWVVCSTHAYTKQSWPYFLGL